MRFVAGRQTNKRASKIRPSLDGKSLEALSNTVSNRVRRRTAEPAEVENGAVRDGYPAGTYNSHCSLGTLFLW